MTQQIHSSGATICNCTFKRGRFLVWRSACTSKNALQLYRIDALDDDITSVYLFSGNIDQLLAVAELAGLESFIKYAIFNDVFFY